MCSNRNCFSNKSIGGAVNLALVGNEPELRAYANFHFNGQFFGSVCLFVDTVVMVSQLCV